ncbi:hypothetical protein [Flavobacterium sp. AG291]|uniref:hypothetical protein n=1 Tax=Flavobacterium sp. AG291 TaxID=2184000 RepID=UPI000E0BD65A|nr:hypothetical protein [Flavobacterium sp. AG291]RDI11865.1 hypothetical protein DEU42_10527 [Flavobacterium sp. AG291]
MKNIKLLLLLILFISCQKEKSNEAEIASENNIEIQQANDEFQMFLDKFPEVRLPLDIEPCSIDDSNMKMLNDSTLIYGKIPSNGKYITTISFDIADCLLPRITTYTLSGKTIDSKPVVIGLCGSDPCYECNEYFRIGKDYRIYSCDSARYDDCINKVSDTVTNIVTYKQGKLNSTGKIELSAEKQKTYYTKKS